MKTINEKLLNQIRTACNPTRQVAEGMGFTPNQFIAHKSKKKKSSASSIYIGVSFIKPKNKWSARIKIKGTSITIGTFHSEIEAARAYNMVAVSAYGDEANINDLTRR